MSKELTLHINGETYEFTIGRKLGQVPESETLIRLHKRGKPYRDFQSNFHKIQNGDLAMSTPVRRYQRLFIIIYVPNFCDYLLFAGIMAGRLPALCFVLLPYGIRAFAGRFPNRALVLRSAPTGFGEVLRAKPRRAEAALRLP